MTEYQKRRTAPDMCPECGAMRKNFDAKPSANAIYHCGAMWARARLGEKPIDEWHLVGVCGATDADKAEHVRHLGARYSSRKPATLSDLLIRAMEPGEYTLLTTNPGLRAAFGDLLRKVLAAEGVDGPFE